MPAVMKPLKITIFYKGSKWVNVAKWAKGQTVGVFFSKLFSILSQTHSRIKYGF